MKDTKTKFPSQPSPIHLAYMLAFLLGRPGVQWTMLLGLSVLAVGPLPIQAATAVTEAWTHHFSNVLSNSVDRPSKAVRDSAGDIIVAGTSDNNASGPDILTIKYSGVDGAMLWQRRQRYSVSANYGYFHAQTSLPVAIAVDASGNVVVSGSTENPENESESESYTAKYARTTGAVLWEKRYYSGDGRAIAMSVDRADNVVVTGESVMVKYAAANGAFLWEKRSDGQFIYKAIAIDRDGNIVLTGTGFFNNGNSNDYYTAKYAAADGGLVWERLFNSPSNGADVPSAVAADASGNVIVTGSSENKVSQHYYTIKYAADGAVLWEQQDNGSQRDFNQPQALAVDASGNVVVTGGAYDNAGGSDYHTVKYAAADGALLWEKRYDGPANFSGDFAQAVALDATGNVVVTGFSTSIADSEPTDEYSPFDIYTAKYAARDGTLLWERRYESNAHFFWNWPPASPGAAAVIVDESGNAIMTGPSSVDDIPFRNKPDYYTAKYAAVDGTVLWEKSYNGPAHYESYSSAVALDTSGNVIVVADSDGESYIAKYAASNGALLLEKRVPGQAHLVVDDSGNLFVTAPPSSENNFYTAKYAGNGSLLWQRRDPEGGTQMALDPLGNLVVASGSYTAKYATSSGDLLWKKQYSGLGGSGQVYAIAVDTNGNIAVTGSFTPNDSHRYEYYTARYAASDGALLWERRYKGSGFLDDAGHALEVDISGNVVVISSNATLKHAAADGALLWEKRYTGIRALALDGGGNVVITGSPGTYKFAAADGALLWLKPFVSFAVVVDSSGNVIVTGESSPSSGSLSTAKYAGADGALIWEKSYKEPGSFYNSAGGSHSIALGPNGTIAIIAASYPRTSFPADVLTVVYREGLPPISIELVPAGVRLRFTGTPGRTYAIERAPVVSGPWNAINTQTAPASGLIEHLDTNPPVATAFYRTSER